VRDKINSDPKLQIGLVALLVVAAAFMLFGGGLGGGGEEEASEAPAAEVEGAPAEGEVALLPEEATSGAIAAFSEAEAASIPAPPPPKPVENAYESGKTVVLLLVHDGGIDDKLVERSTREIADRANAELFVVPAKQVARYAAITLGVDLQQVPALITVRPKRLSDGQVQASVIYGFQSPQRIDQAIRDAEYDGPETTYHPN
jgi:hypothetical protein